MTGVIPGWGGMTPREQEVYNVNTQTIDAIRGSGGSLSRSEPIYKGEEAYTELLKDYPDTPPQYLPQVRDISDAEGYTRGIYDDTSGYVTSGMGQTRGASGIPPAQAVINHIDKAKSVFPQYDLYDDSTKSMLVDAAYRGDLRYKSSGKPQKWTELFRDGQYADAGVEHIDHPNYRDSQGIRNRFDKRVEEMDRLEGLRGTPKSAWGRGVQSNPNIPAQYTVQQGDSLTKIASDNDMTVDQLVSMNSIQDPNSIQVGQRLQLQAVPRKQTQEAPPQADAGFLSPVNDFINGIFGGDESGKPQKEVTELIPKKHKDTAKSLWDTIFGD